MALGLSGCPDPSPPPPIPDSGLTGPCGSGPTRLELGKGDPFAMLTTPAFTVDQGFQGGYHVDVSIRVRGAFDPDAADVDLSLFDGERRIAHHVTRDWYLEINQSDRVCEYLLARLVLVDAEGGLLDGELIPALLGSEIRLEADIRSPGGEVQETYPVDLTELVLLR